MTKLPKEFDAAILESLRSPLSFKKIKVKSILPGQVMIRMRYSGICRSQLMEISGLRGPDPFLPHLLGHEGVGEVVAIGENVSKVQIGDPVIVGWIKSSGMTSVAPKFKEKNKTINAGVCTTFSEYTIVAENRVYIKPPDLPFELAPLFGCSLLTGMGMALNEVTIDANSNVMIYGLGGIGIGSLLASIHKKPKSIAVVDISQQRRDLARRLGATDSLHPNDIEFDFKLAEITGGEGIHFGFESAGYTETIVDAFKKIRKLDGVLVFSSHPEKYKKICLDPYDLILGKKIIGSWGGKADPDRDVTKFNNILLKLNLDPKILGLKYYKFKEINKAIYDLQNGLVARPILDFN